MTERKPVGLERTILCATRFWSIDHIVERGYRRGATTPTLLQGVRQVVRKQGFRPDEITRTIRKLEDGGFIRLGGQGVAKTIKLTEKGGRVGCASVKLAPWTNEGYLGNQLKGCGRCR